MIFLCACKSWEARFLDVLQSGDASLRDFILSSYLLDILRSGDNQTALWYVLFLFLLFGQFPQTWCSFAFPPRPIQLRRTDISVKRVRHRSGQWPVKLFCWGWRSRERISIRRIRIPWLRLGTPWFPCNIGENAAENAYWSDNTDGDPNIKARRGRRICRPYYRIINPSCNLWTKASRRNSHLWPTKLASVAYFITLIIGSTPLDAVIGELHKTYPK